MGTNTTPRLGLRYPDGAEAPNVPLWQGNLANDVEAKMAGRVLGTVTQTTQIAIAATETVISPLLTITPKLGLVIVHAVATITTSANDITGFLRLFRDGAAVGPQIVQYFPRITGGNATPTYTVSWSVMMAVAPNVTTAINMRASGTVAGLTATANGVTFFATEAASW